MYYYFFKPCLIAQVDAALVLPMQTAAQLLSQQQASFHNSTAAQLLSQQQASCSSLVRTPSPLQNNSENNSDVVSQEINCLEFIHTNCLGFKYYLKGLSLTQGQRMRI